MKTPTYLLLPLAAPLILAQQQDSNHAAPAAEAVASSTLLLSGTEVLELWDSEGCCDTRCCIRGGGLSFPRAYVEEAFLESECCADSCMVELTACEGGNDDAVEATSSCSGRSAEYLETCEEFPSVLVGFYDEATQSFSGATAEGSAWTASSLNEVEEICGGGAEEGWPGCKEYSDVLAPDRFLGVGPDLSIRRALFPLKIVGTITLLSEIASDNAALGHPAEEGSYESYKEFEYGTFTAGNSQLAQIWRWLYTGYLDAEHALYFYREAEKASSVQLGQLSFLSGYYSLLLFQLFGRIPVVDGFDGGRPRFLYPAPDDIRLLRGRTTSRLQEAVAMLTLTEPATIDRLMPNVDAARFLLAKTLLLPRQDADGSSAAQEERQKAVQDAYALLQAIVTSGRHRLLEDVNVLFTPEGEAGEESILEMKFYDDDTYVKSGLVGWGLPLNAGNSICTFYGIRGYVGPEFHAGFGFAPPTQELWDAFSPEDLRRRASILKIDDWIAEKEAEEPGSGSSITYVPPAQDTGMYNRKYMLRQRSFGFPDPGIGQAAMHFLMADVNQRLVRYAEVLLLAAEAALDLSAAAKNIDDAPGKVQEALGYLNAVRTRAGLAETETVSKEDIAQQRRLEFAGEGMHSFEGLGSCLLPIPQDEIDRHGGLLTQNPGY